MTDTQPFWAVTIHNGVRVCVQPTIQSMSAYILLEQEDWFEDEMDFIRALVTPDMNVLDIGANHGVYGLTIANQLQTGHVWAFEPTIAPGRMLERSIALNGFSGRMQWIHAGLSDHDGSAEITVFDNSEVNSLYAAGGRKERIELHALDAFLARERIDARIDFVKLDAEGEEIKIVAGGREFFSGQSSLVMFELKHGSQVNHGLIEAFQALGYDIYRLAPGLGALVPFEPDAPDGFLLNLFACKPDRAEELVRRGLLVTGADADVPPPAADWRERLLALPFAEAYGQAWRNADPPSPDHEAALSACLLARDSTLPAAMRFTLAKAALARVTEIANAGKGNVALWLMRLNLCHLLGERSMSISIARKLVALPPATLQTLRSPYLPPAPEFYDRDIGANHERLLDVIREFLEYQQAYSTYYTNDPLEPLSALTGRPGHGLGLDRRLVLMARRRGLSLNIAGDHPLFEHSANREIWREVASV